MRMLACRTKTTWVHGFGAVMLAMALSACSSTGDSDKTHRYKQPDAQSVPTVDASIRLPFQDYQLSTPERARIQESHARLLENCMRGRGFNASIGGDYLRGHQNPKYGSPLLWGGPLGTMPLEHARQFGYKTAPRGPFARGPGFYLSSLTNLFSESLTIGTDVPADTAFYGKDSGRGDPGCLSEVEDAIDSPLVDLIDLDADLGQLTREHPQLELAVKQWVTCMKQSGYTYHDVWKPSSEFFLGFVSQRQINIATADVKCTTKSGWANYYYYILADYQRQAIKKDPQLFESALEAEKARRAAIQRELDRVE